MHTAMDPHASQSMSRLMNAVRTSLCAWAHRAWTSHRSEPAIPKVPRQRRRLATENGEADLCAMRRMAAA